MSSPPIDALPLELMRMIADFVDPRDILFLRKASPFFKVACEDRFAATFFVKQRFIFSRAGLKNLAAMTERRYLTKRLKEVEILHIDFNVHYVPGHDLRTQALKLLWCLEVARLKRHDGDVLKLLSSMQNLKKHDLHPTFRVAAYQSPTVAGPSLNPDYGTLMTPIGEWDMRRRLALQGPLEMRPERGLHGRRCPCLANPRDVDCDRPINSLIKAATIAQYSLRKLDFCGEEEDRGSLSSKAFSGLCSMPTWGLEHSLENVSSLSLAFWRSEKSINIPTIKAFANAACNITSLSLARRVKGVPYVSVTVHRERPQFIVMTDHLRQLAELFLYHRLKTLELSGIEADDDHFARILLDHHTTLDSLSLKHNMVQIEGSWRPILNAIAFSLDLQHFQCIGMYKALFQSFSPPGNSSNGLCLVGRENIKEQVKRVMAALNGF